MISSGMVSTIWYLFTFAFGASIASFLNVVIYRLPNDMSVVKPDSHCPTCKSPIAWYDNLPCLSYLLLRGRCRKCKVAYGKQYWLLEIMGGGIGVGLWFWLDPNFEQALLFPNTLKWLYWQGFAFALVALSWIDFEHLIIPDEISIFLGCLGLLGLSFHDVEGVIDHLIGMVAGGGFLLLVAGIGYLIYRREAMGMGDVKLLALIGLFLGWRVLPLVLFLSAVQAIFLVVIISAGEKFFNVKNSFVRTTEEVDAHFGESELYQDNNEPNRLAIPFGPFLALAAFESLILGDSFLWQHATSLLDALLP